MYSRDAWTARNGFVIEALVSVPVTLPYWQSLNLSVQSGEYVRAMRGWNHVTSTWVLPLAQGYFESGIQYPGIEGGLRTMSFTSFAARTVGITRVSPDLADGRNALIRMEFGADSSMVVTINGAQVARRRYAPTPDGRYHLFISGHSVETAVRVRRLRVWVR